jgi:hypothetical protein
MMKKKIKMKATSRRKRRERLKRIQITARHLSYIPTP